MNNPGSPISIKDLQPGDVFQLSWETLEKLRYCVWNVRSDIILDNSCKSIGSIIFSTGELHRYDGYDDQVCHLILRREAKSATLVTQLVH